MSINNIKVNMIGLVIVLSGILQAQNFFPADDQRILYYGRLDPTNPAAPAHSWPVSISIPNLKAPVSVSG